MSIGKKLYQLRASKNFTKERVAQELGVSKVAYGKWENDLSKPNFDNIILLCNFYGISKDELMEEEKNIQQQNNTFHYSPNIVNSQNPTVNYTFPNEFIERIIKNQDKISEIVQFQNKLFQEFLTKK